VVHPGRDLEPVRRSVEPVVGGVVDGVGNVDVHAADHVDHLLEARQVHHRVVVDVHADEILDLLDERRHRVVG